MTKQTTRWDRAREITEQMLRLQAELEREWPAGFSVTEANRFWRTRLVDSMVAIQALRQATIAGQDMERVEKYGSAARRV